MRVGIRVPPCASLPVVAEFVREVEQEGFDEVWFPDSQLLWRDAFAVAATAAMATSRITVGTAVTNLVTRHPAAVDFGAATSRLREPRSVPIHLAASGPRNLRLAGEIADGVILLSGVSSEPLAAATAKVRAGATAAGRGPVPATASAFCRITGDVERDWEAAVRACDPYVSDEAVAAFARRFCLFGSPEEIAGRLAEVHAHGVDAVLLQHVGSYDLPRQLLADFAGRVLPILRRP